MKAKPARGETHQSATLWTAGKAPRLAAKGKQQQ